MPIVVAGPTASGKSALAIALAEAIGGELVCADSRQVYAGLTIASAGPTDDERARVPHHGFGTRPPSDEFTAGDFLRTCDAAVSAICARDRTPILVGGTGLYLRAWRLGLDAAPVDAALREDLKLILLHEGLSALVDMLKETVKDEDPDALGRIDVHNPVRVMRAIEHARAGTGARDVAELLARPARHPATWVLLDAPLEELEPRIRARARTMFERGIVEEARALRATLPAGHALLRTLGTEEALAVADGALSIDDAVARTTLRTRQYARRQRTWFKREPWWRRLSGPLAATADHVEEALSFRGASS